MACRLYNTERCLQLQLFNRPNFGVHFIVTLKFRKDIAYVRAHVRTEILENHVSCVTTSSKVTYPLGYLNEYI